MNDVLHAFRRSLVRGAAFATFARSRRCSAEADIVHSPDHRGTIGISHRNADAYVSVGVSARAAIRLFYVHASRTSVRKWKEERCVLTVANIADK